FFPLSALRVCVCVRCVCVCVCVCACDFVSSCGGLSGRIVRSFGCRPHTGRAWLRCVCGSVGGARLNGQIARRIRPPCTCRASHLRERKREREREREREIERDGLSHCEHLIVII